MSDPQIPEIKPSSLSKPPKVPAGGGRFSHSHNFPNPLESVNPDAATLRDQWRFGIRQYNRWYSHAWGTTIFVGASFFTLGWIIKGSNHIHSFKSENTDGDKDKAAASADVPQSR